MSKQLSDGTQIPDALYYYILDYVDRCKQTNKYRWFITTVHTLDKAEFKAFVTLAIKDELNTL